MKHTNSNSTLLFYINDLLALERSLKRAVDWQLENEHLNEQPEPVALLNEIAFSTDARLAAMHELSEWLGRGSGGVKEAVAAAAGTLVEMYDKARRHPVSRMLRDDVTALSLAATGYTMLYTAGVALHHGHIAALAHRHLRDITPLVTQLSRLIPEVVLHELSKEFPDVNREAAYAAREATERAWQHPAAMASR